MLFGLSPICKRRQESYGGGVKDNVPAKAPEVALGKSVDEPLAQTSSESVNQNYVSGQGFMELGLPDQARKEFESIPVDDPCFIAARRALMKLSDCLDKAEQSRKADEGLHLIREGCHDCELINETALRLHFAGRTREAYDLTHAYSASIEWTSIDFYGMATYASRVGEWEDAAWHLSNGMRRNLSFSYSKMFADIDLEPLFRHAAQGEISIHTALCLANPFLTAALSAFSDAEGDVDGILHQEMPAAFRSYMICDYAYSGRFFLAPTAPLEIRQRFHAWFRSVNDRILALAKRGFERAQQMVLDAQMDFAIAAAKRGDFFAARHHVVFAVNARPDCFEEFDHALSPLGLAYFFDDIRDVWRQDGAFRELMKAMTPTTTICPKEQMKILEDCGSASKATTFWILGRAVVARHLDGYAVAIDWSIEVIRRWPSDPAAFHNILLIYERIGAWDSTALVLANVPLAFHRLNGAGNLIKRIETRGREMWSPDRAVVFYGQPDLGGIVRSELLPSGR